MVNDVDGPYRKPFSADSLAEFSWDRTSSWAEEKAPLTVACLRSMFPPTKRIRKRRNSYVTGKQARHLTELEVQHMLDRRLSVLLSVPLYTSNRRVGFVQTALGVELLRHRCPLKTFGVLSGLGLVQCKSSSRTQTRRVHKDDEGQVRTWRDQIQLSGRMHQCSQDLKKAASYVFSWGRVRVPSPSKVDACSDRSHSFVSWMFRFAHRSRVNFRAVRGTEVRAVDVSPSDILPSKQTYERLRQRMKTMVMRIIVDHLTGLETLRTQVERHIPHLYTRLMNQESKTVSLGAVVPDLSEDSVSAALGLKDFIPELYRKPFYLLYCGDAPNRACNRHTKTTRDQEHGDDRPTPEHTPGLKADGMIEAPPEFQREHLFHEEMLKLLQSETSVRSRGSLHHILSLFKFKTFNNMAKDYFINMWDFITFVTSAYVTLFAVTDLHLDAVDQQPPGLPSDPQDQMELVRDLAHRLVDLVWSAPSQEDINVAASVASVAGDEHDKNVSPLCFCRRDCPGEPLVRCCSNLCSVIWFHQSCVQAQTRTDPAKDRFCSPGSQTRADTAEDWFCSPGCRESGSYVFCVCKEQRGGQMVQCGLMDQCRRHEWYHRDCLTPDQQNHVQNTSWFCSDICSKVYDGEDFLLNYTKAVVWEGLYHMTRRDAVQEGDGDAMTDFCRMDLVLLWTRKHLGLFSTWHRMLTGMGGFYPARVRQELKWNRVVNPEGTPGGNVSLDLMTELMTHEFKGAIEFGKGGLRPQQVDQSAHLSGPQARNLDRLFSSSGYPTMSEYLTRLRTSTARWTDHVAQFVSEFRRDELFCFSPGRRHEGFDQFRYQNRVRSPREMGQTMRRLSEEMDRNQDLIF